MRIGIVGSGRMGGGLGRLWAHAGHEVMFSDVRGLEEMRALAEEVGHGARAGSIRETAAWCDIVLLATHWAQCKSALEECGSLEGKILIDIINPVKPDFSDLEFGFTTSASEEIARLVPQARVVKALNTIPSPVLALEGCRVAGQKVSGFYCGDDGAAKQVVALLVADAGFDPVDCGPLSSARYLEALGMLLIRIVVTLKASPEIAFSLVRKVE
ncbi:Putative reductase [Candidatus Sumerlaea chitinivorans]|uniref:Reductase n=1 Tax=Sumerlaea chitinivorans TaxID=2250252 RepID=A0A2Z4Y7A7_SUMC1|nr:Putative reductase [Candidatus Sumerlaea chitinivorans]